MVRRGQDVVEGVVPAVHVVGVHELPAEAGRAADVRREHGDPGRGQRLVLRVERPGAPAPPARRAGSAPPARPGRARRPVQPAGQRQPVPAGEALQRRHDQRGGRAPSGPSVTRARRACAVSRCHSSRGRSGPSTPRITRRPVAAESTGVDATRPGRPAIGVTVRVAVSNSSSSLAPGHVPDQQQQPAGVVGVHPLQVGVVPGGERPRLAAPPVRARTAGRSAARAGQADVGGEVHVHRAGVVRGRRPDQRHARSSRWRRAGAAAEVLVRQPVDDRHELLPALAVLEITRNRSSSEMSRTWIRCALGQRVELGRSAGRPGSDRVGLPGAGPGEGDHEAVPAAGPRAELDVRVGVRRRCGGRREPSGRTTHTWVRTPPSGRHRAGQPAAVGRPAHRDDRVVGERDVPGRAAAARRGRRPAPTAAGRRSGR